MVGKGEEVEVEMEMETEVAVAGGGNRNWRDAYMRCPQRRVGAGSWKLGTGEVPVGTGCRREARYQLATPRPLFFFQIRSPGHWTVVRAGGSRKEREKPGTALCTFDGEGGTCSIDCNMALFFHHMFQCWALILVDEPKGHHLSSVLSDDISRHRHRPLQTNALFFRPRHSTRMPGAVPFFSFFPCRASIKHTATIARLTRVGK